MSVTLINPANNLPLTLEDGVARDSEGNDFPVVKGAMRITREANYTDNFGMQWNMFDRT